MDRTEPSEHRSSRGRPREFDRDEVLRRAIDVFWRQSYETTSVSELVEALGIGRQSLYLAFGSKRGLFEEALARYLDMELDPIVERLSRPGSPLENVRGVLRMLQERAGARDYKGCMIGHTVAELGIREPELGRRLAGAMRRFEEGFEEALQCAIEAGELPPDRDPRALARTLMATIQGLALWAPSRRSAAWARDVVSGLLELLDGDGSRRP